MKSSNVSTRFVRITEPMMKTAVRTLEGSKWCRGDCKGIYKALILWYNMYCDYLHPSLSGEVCWAGISIWTYHKTVLSQLSLPRKRNGTCTSSKSIRWNSFSRGMLSRKPNLIKVLGILPWRWGLTRNRARYEWIVTIFQISREFCRSSAFFWGFDRI